MERLTERTADGIAVKEEHGENVLKTIYQCYGAEPMPHYENCDEGYCAMEKLAEYEDLEEQGKLLKLSCAVGNKIYKIWSCGKNGKSIVEFVISHIDIDNLPQIEFSYHKENTECNYYFFKVEDIGKTVFLTKEEAETALQEMNEREGESHENA